MLRLESDSVLNVIELGPQHPCPSGSGLQAGCKVTHGPAAGTIPPAWGADGSLGSLHTLQLASNLLNGTIPQM